MKPFVILKKGQKVEAIPDTFSLSAAILHIIWILYYGLWHLLLVFGLYIASVASLHSYGIIGNNLYYFMIVVSLVYLWAYGNFWRQLKYKRRGYKIIGMVIAKNEDEALYKSL